MAGLPGSVTIGTQVTVTATGYLPGETVTFVWHSTPITLGTAIADAHGTARLTFTVPATEIGPHTLIATGATSQAVTQAVTQAAAQAVEPPPTTAPPTTPVTPPRASGPLPVTGAKSRPLGLLGLALTLLGLTAVAATATTRRRRLT